jgi:iron complex outermembrane recepter protein
MKNPRLSLTRLPLRRPTVGALLLPWLVAASLPAFAQTTASTTPATPPASKPEALSAVEVVGRRQSGGYQADEVSGTKSSLPLRELPQSVRVISRQAMDDLGALRLDEVLDYVGGISRQNNFGGLWDNIAVRGLAGNENTGMAMLVNGFAGNRGFNAPRDTANVERIEFLKGPAAALYGASEPGGTLNVVTKKPQWRSGNAVEAYVGSFDFYRAALDSTGPLGESVAYRLNVAVEDRGSFREQIKAKRQVVAPALTWRVSPDTTVDYSGELLHHQTPLDRGVVAINNQLGAVPRGRFNGEPADGDVKVDNQTHQLVAQHQWAPDWRSRAGLSYRTGTMQGFSTEPTSLQADNRTLRRQRRFRDYGSNDVSLQAELAGKVRSGDNDGAMVHELLVGVETYRFTLDQLMLRINPSAAAPYAIDLFAPVYGQPQPTPGPNTDTQEEQRNTAVYLQDAITLSPQWRAVVGVRADRYDQTLHNRRTGVRTPQTPTSTAPRVGLSYLPDAQWTLYANAGRSFRANVGSDAAGQAFAPEEGQALELGAKWERADKRLGATVALFDIRKRNVLTGDPANAGFSVSAGEVGSRGVELDLAGQITAQWRVTASLAYNDVTVLADNTLVVGSRLLNTPRVNGSVLAVYESALSNGTLYGVGGGFTHMGERLGQTGAPDFQLPAYTTAKATAYWRASPTLRVSLDVDNLFDATYYTSSYSRVWVTPGSARSVTLGLQAKF